MHTLAFILGREPALSLAEIKAVFENHSFDFTFSYVSRDVALIKSRHVVDAHALMEELGGTIKIGTVLPVLKGTTPDPAELVWDLSANDCCVKAASLPVMLRDAVLP